MAESLILVFSGSLLKFATDLDPSNPLKIQRITFWDLYDKDEILRYIWIFSFKKGLCCDKLPVEQVPSQ